jgi:hypothetical protein
MWAGTILVLVLSYERLGFVVAKEFRGEFNGHGVDVMILSYGKDVVTACPYRKPQRDSPAGSVLNLSARQTQTARGCPTNISENLVHCELRASPMSVVSTNWGVASASHVT